MVDKETSRLSRLTAIITLLQSKRLITAGVIAKKFGISIRTVYRDIKAIEQAGIPVFMEEGKGYSLMEGYTLPPVMFTEAEANALITAGQLVSKNKDASFVHSYTEAVTKIKSLLKYAAKDKTELLAARIHFRQNPGNTITSNNLTLIQSALTNLNLLKIKYQSEEATISDRMIEPLALYSTQENWILIAYCRLRKEKRTFRLDRIQHIELTNEHFSAYNFSLQEYFDECKKNSQYP